MGGYGGYQVVGYRNLGELQENLDSLMLRRLKKLLKQPAVFARLHNFKTPNGKGAGNFVSCAPLKKLSLLKIG